MDKLNEPYGPVRPEDVALQWRKRATWMLVRVLPLSAGHAAQENPVRYSKREDTAQSATSQAFMA